MKALTRQAEEAYRFDAFRLDAVKRVLLHEGEVIPLTSKRFDILLLLVRNCHRVVDKDELMSEVWPDTVVEESNLTHNISVLRKALGEQPDEHRFIVTIPGQGYRFVASLSEEAVDSSEEVMYERSRSRLIIEEAGTAEADLPEQPRAIPALPVSGTHPAWWAEPRARAVALAVVVALVAVCLMIYLLRPAPSSGPIRSIAVLPFKPLVADDRNESLEMGMADTLIAKLSNIREINVRPISAVRKYAGLEQDAVAAGREQKVDVVIDGQIQKFGERIRVTVRLLRIQDGATLWTSQFDDKLTDMLRVQDSISERVTGVLALTLTGEEKKRLARHDTENTEAHQLYLLGRYHLNRMTDDGFLKGLQYFQQAIEKDSSFALAHVGVAESYNMLAGMNVLRPNEVYPKARAAAETALKLDDSLGEAHTAFADVRFSYDWDWAGAESEFKRALEISASNSDAHQEYGYYLCYLGRFDEAITEMRLARELDPVSPARITNFGQVLYVARRYDEAIEECQKALDMDPNLGFAHWVSGLAYMKKGMYEPATRSFQKSIPLSGDSPDEPAALGQAYALSGKRAEARKILDELEQQSKRKYISPTVIAMLCAALGEKDKAFALLDKGYGEKDSLLVLLRAEPLFDPLRSDPRFDELLHRVGL